MFDEFSPKYEQVFRIIFIIWASFWGFINLLWLVGQYASFTAIYDSASTGDLGMWWINTTNHVLSITFGISLLALTLSVTSIIRKRKKMKNLLLMITLVIFYYLFVNLMSIIGTTIFTPEDFARDLVFMSAWLLPSFILMIFHFLYVHNLGQYNEELLETTKKE